MPQKKRGFVTIAVGAQRYYALAENLLRSYRLHNSDDTPFAILCDRECVETAGFDRVVVMEKPAMSYMDKLRLAELSPFEETIFVDADALFLRDPGVLWQDFQDCPDVCAYGNRLSRDSRKGWFCPEEMGELAPRLEFGVQMHGGAYYLRRSEDCERVFARAKEFAANYGQYRFAHFDKPADEPVIALSMALEGWEPCPKLERILFLPEYDGHVRLTREGRVLLKGKETGAVIFHFGNANTVRFAYRYLLELQQGALAGQNVPQGVWKKLRRECAWMEFRIPAVRKMKRFVKYAMPRGLFLRLKALKG